MFSLSDEDSGIRPDISREIATHCSNLAISDSVTAFVSHVSYIQLLEGFAFCQRGFNFAVISHPNSVAFSIVDHVGTPPPPPRAYPVFRKFCPIFVLLRV